jgi:hypothetical protein
MMFHEKMVVAIKTNGKVLREFKDAVYVPFSSEYSIFVKNLNSVRALVTVEIDGTDVGEGQQFVIAGNSEVEITRFIKDGNLQSGNRFKFIERSDSIEQHRGVGAEDGLVRVSFQYERRIQTYVPPVVQPQWIVTHPVYPTTPYYSTTTTISNAVGSGAIDHFSAKGVLGGSLRGTSLNASGSMQSNSMSTQNASVNYSATVNDAGITVPGSVSEQKFTEVSGFPVEATTHVIVMKLLGQTETARVEQPITVKSKPKCVTCGKTGKSTAQFCSNCGTSLTII